MTSRAMTVATLLQPCARSLHEICLSPPAAQRGGAVNPEGADRHPIRVMLCPAGCLGRRDYIYNAPMLIKKTPDIRSSEITPRSVYLNRRDFLTASGAALVAAGCGSVFDEVSAQSGGLTKLTNVKKSSFSTTEKQNTLDEITSYNNFYEFGTDKGDPKEYSGKFRTKPWSIAVEGEVAKPATYNLEDFIKPYALEERVYRLRCVEAWSMVIPWIGSPLKDVISRVQPTGKAKYIEFTTLLDPSRMPYQRTSALDWPYVEGLRLDE